MNNKTLRSCIYSLYVRPKYKLINPPHSQIVCAQVRISGSKQRARVRQSLIRTTGIVIMHLFFKFLLIIILITGLVLYANSKRHI